MSSHRQGPVAVVRVPTWGGDDMEKVSLGVVYPNQLGRQGLCLVLGDQGLAVAAAAASVHDLASSLRGEEGPQVVLIAGFDSDAMLEACRQARAAFPAAKLSAIIRTFDVDTVVASFRAGADGLLMQELSCEGLGGTLKLIALGQRIVPAQILDSLEASDWRHRTGAWQANVASGKLSERETEILGALVGGDANKVIARNLNITEATVKVHIKAILRKLNVVNRTQAAIWATMRGLDLPAADGRARRVPLHALNGSASAAA